MMQNEEIRPGGRPLALKATACCVALALVGFLCPAVYGYADDQPVQPDIAEDVVADGSKAPEDTANPSKEPGAEAVPGGPDAGKLPQDAAGNDAGAPDAGDDVAPLTEDPAAEAAAAPEEGAPEASALAETEEAPIRSFAGATMFETAAAEAKAAYPQGAESAVVVGPGDAWIDALSATGLAASKGPILFTERDSLHQATKQALKELGVKSVVIVGGTAAVSAKAEQAIAGAGVKVEARLGGSDCFDTQMKIYEYGRANKLWDASMAIVATASHFGDALSVSPVAFSKKAPIFLTASEGQMRKAQQQALVQGAREGGFASIVIVGGPAAVSTQVEGFVSGLTYWSGGSYVRLAGATQYETSAKIATWATSSQGLSWDRLAFATGKAPYDALAGSVLQGGSKSALLLIDGANTATLDAAVQHKGSIGHVRFLGGTAAVPQALRDAIVSKLGISTAAKPKETEALEGPEAPVVAEGAGRGSEHELPEDAAATDAPETPAPSDAPKTPASTDDPSPSTPSAAPGAQKDRAASGTPSVVDSESAA